MKEEEDGKGIIILLGRCSSFRTEYVDLSLCLVHEFK